MKFDLCPPGFVEIISVADNRFVPKIDMCRAHDELVMLAVITGFDERLRIDVAVRRPVHETCRKQIGLLLN